MLVTAVGIGASFITTFLGYLKIESVETKLKLQLIVSTVLMSAMLIAVIGVLPTSFDIIFASHTYTCTQW